MNRLIRMKGKGVEYIAPGCNDMFTPQEFNCGTYPETMTDVYLRTLREIKFLLVVLIIIMLATALFKKG